MKDAFHNLLDEPKAPNAPDLHRLDYALVFVLAGLSITEAYFVDGLPWRAVAVPLAVAVAMLLLWRRSHPLQVVALGFSAQAAVDSAAILSTDKSTLLAATLAVGLILTYSLCRWASGREVVAGLAFVVANHFATELLNPEVPVAEAILGVTTWMFPAAFALAMRYRSRARDRTVFDARMMERNRLARELHDTVAHHITAITIQAQAAQLIAQESPEQAMEILSTIEQESTAAVDEMQQIVRVLRDPVGTAPASAAPRPLLSDIAGLGNAGGIAVEVELQGELQSLGPTVEASLFRVAQEAITNARRHARHATRVAVRVTATEHEVRLSVSDDGDPRPSQPGTNGFGLIGMEERVALLGGTFHASPGADCGWVVTAVFPRTDRPFNAGVSS